MAITNTLSADQIRDQLMEWLSNTNDQDTLPNWFFYRNEPNCAMDHTKYQDPDHYNYGDGEAQWNTKDGRFLVMVCYSSEDGYSVLLDELEQETPWL